MKNASVKKTFPFTFPNGGHSIRKLVMRLRELGDVKVKLVYEEAQYIPGEFDMWFEETDSNEKYGVFDAQKLADKLLTMGTRFTAEIKYGEVQLSFHTKWDDIYHNPGAFGVL